MFLIKKQTFNGLLKVIDIRMIIMIKYLFIYTKFRKFQALFALRKTKLPFMKFKVI